MSSDVIDPWTNDVWHKTRACSTADGVTHICHVAEVGHIPRRFVRYYFRCMDADENSRTFTPGGSLFNLDNIAVFYTDEDRTNCIACLVTR